MTKPSRAATTRHRPVSGNLRPSPLAAYRAGLQPDRWEPPTAHLADCIVIAEILQAATKSRSSAKRAAMIERAAGIACGLMTPEQVAFGCRQDPIDVTGPVAVIRTLIEEMELPGLGNRHLSEHILESLSLLFPLHSAEGGRILGTRSRNAGSMGEEELRFERARMLLAVGREVGDDSLLVKAWGQIAGYREARGNLPKSERAAFRETKYAMRSRDPRLISHSMMALGVVRGMRGDLEGSVEYLWRALNIADHPRVRAGILANLGETLYRSGHFRAARAARALSVQAGMDVSHLLVSLGGYAVCCAALDDSGGVTWASSHAIAIADKYPPNRGTAQGLLGCADACGEVGLDHIGQLLYRRGLAIAEAHGYHDLRFRADPRTRHRERQPARQFLGEAEEARKSIVRMAPDGVAADCEPVLI
jgi:hypothetical protein